MQRHISKQKVYCKDQKIIWKLKMFWWKLCRKNYMLYKNLPSHHNV